MKYRRLPTRVRAEKLKEPDDVGMLTGTQHGTRGSWRLIGQNEAQWYVKDDIFKKTYKHISRDIYEKTPEIVDAYIVNEPTDIKTLEGKIHADPGDYIVTGINGEKWPLRPDWFEEAYEPIGKENTKASGGKLFTHDMLKKKGVEKSMKKDVIEDLSKSEKKPKLGTGERFDKLKNELKEEGKSEESAEKIAASVGRKKYGAKRMAGWAHKSEDSIRPFADDGHGYEDYAELSKSMADSQLKEEVNGLQKAIDQIGEMAVEKYLPKGMKIHECEIHGKFLSHYSNETPFCPVCGIPTQSGNGTTAENVNMVQAIDPITGMEYTYDNNVKNAMQPGQMNLIVPSMTY